MNELSDIIRTQVRGDRQAEREKRRTDVYNKCRPLPSSLLQPGADKTYNDNDVKRFVREMKHSSDCKESVLSQLKNAFIQDRLNMVAFLKIERGLHTLVGYLMNSDPVIQLLAAECCCNLSLGDAKTCHQLARAAAPYLVAILQGMNYNVMNYSLMTLGNMCAASIKAVNIIKSQGALKSFEHTITIPETRESTAFALVMYSKATFPHEGEHFVGVTHAALPFLESSLNVGWLVYHLSSSEVTRAVLVEQHVSERIIAHLHSFERIECSNVQAVTCLVRALANLCAESSGDVASTVLDCWDVVVTVAKRLASSDYPHLRSELAWLLGNLLNHQHPRVQEALLQRDQDFKWLGNSCFLD